MNAAGPSRHGESSVDATTRASSPPTSTPRRSTAREHRRRSHRLHVPRLPARRVHRLDRRRKLGLVRKLEPLGRVFVLPAVAGCAVRLALQMQCLRLGARFNAPVRRDRQGPSCRATSRRFAVQPFRHLLKRAQVRAGAVAAVPAVLVARRFGAVAITVAAQTAPRIHRRAARRQRRRSGAQHTVPAQRRYRSTRVRVRRRLQSRNARRLLIGESPFHSDASRRQLLRRRLRHA